MAYAYSELHRAGFAHSVEVWSGDILVGGLYGVALGKVFFGESMFSLEDNTSKLALFYLILHLKHWGFELIDCQIPSNHLISLGAINVSRQDFNNRLVELVDHEENRIGKWEINRDLINKVND
jgi:leucyl/phenylalanyl-tRNA--protein transferase